MAEAVAARPRKQREWPSHLIGELLSKRWMDTAIPVAVLVALVVILSAVGSNVLSMANLADFGRLSSETAFVVLGLSLVLIVGGIDLSLGSTFALANFCALYLMHIAEWPVAATTAATLGVGALLGAVNGLLIGYLGLRAFLTTLITLIIYRALYDILILDHSTAIASRLPDSAAWEFVGFGTVIGVPFGLWLLALVALAGHLFLTRLRPGWHVAAIGGSRRAAYNAGIDVRFTIASCYAAAGTLTAVGATLFASRLSTVGGDVGAGLEITALTAAVLGGIRLGGGSGSVSRALVGTAIVLLAINSLTTMGVSGGVNRMLLATLLVAAVVIDIRWMRNRHKLVGEVYVSPAWHAPGPILPTSPDCGTAWAQNDRLRDVDLIGLGRIEAPEDVILDEDDDLYAGSRNGDIVRFFAPDYERMEVFAHIGGMPAGMAFDRERNLHVCVAGMGLYRIDRQRRVAKVTDETNRSWSSINDDSRLRIADDLDIAPDGRIFFSEATTRYEAHDWFVDALEARGNGRILCHDPTSGRTRTVLRDLRFPNGVCMTADGESFLFAETWGCSVKRHWYDGPKRGTTEVVLENLPGYPDNINAASDGHYWLALCGMRSPAFDLAWQMPSFRRRMALRLPFDEWLFPNINTGCIVKFSERGEVLETIWDLGGLNHPMITSMREHKGRLFIGGLMNNRIGVLTLPGADPTFMQCGRLWRPR